jgi:hypothetical protein
MPVDHPETDTQVKGNAMERGPSTDPRRRMDIP